MIDANPLSIVNYLLSLVKPYYLSTIANLCPTMQLNKLLFPQFGSPTSETLNFEVSSVNISHFFSFFFFYYLKCIFSISWLLNKINWVDLVFLVKEYFWVCNKPKVLKQLKLNFIGFDKDKKSIFNLYFNLVRYIILKLNNSILVR